MPKDCHPVKQSEANFMKERDDKLSHLIAISMNHAGFPIRLFTTNRWITADNWYKADDVIKMLDYFEMDFASPFWPVNIWLTAMLRLFRPQIMELVRERDATVGDWQKKHPENDAFEDRGCDITSARKISVAAQIRRVNQALRRCLSSCRDKPAELNTASDRAVGGTAWADRPGPPVPAPRGRCTRRSGAASPKGCRPTNSGTWRFLP